MSSLESLPLHSRFRARIRLVCVTLARGSIDFAAIFGDVEEEDIIEDVD